MNIQDIGAIGELLAAVLFLGSLVYVGIQIRQSAQSQRALIRQHWTEQANEWNRFVLGNSDLRKLVLHGRNLGFKGLDEAEQFQLGVYYQAACWTISSFHRHHSERVIDDETWKEAEQLLSNTYCKSAGFIEYWKLYQHEFGDSFRSYVNNKLGGGT